MAEEVEGAEVTEEVEGAEVEKAEVSSQMARMNTVIFFKRDNFLNFLLQIVEKISRELIISAVLNKNSYQIKNTLNTDWNQAEMKTSCYTGNKISKNFWTS